jgi:glutaredoxin 3
MITIYSTPNCTYCKKAKEYFTKEKLAYKEIDVAADVQAREEMVEKSQQMGVPVIEINDYIIIGFDLLNIKKALGPKKEVLGPSDPMEENVCDSCQ